MACPAGAAQARELARRGGGGHPARMTSQLHLSDVMADVPVSSLVERRPRLAIRRGTLHVPEVALRELVAGLLGRFQGHLVSLDEDGRGEIRLGGQHAVPIVGPVHFVAGVTLSVTTHGRLAVRLAHVDARGLPLPVATLRDQVCDVVRRSVAAPQGFTPGQGEVLWEVDLAAAARDRGVDLPPAESVSVTKDGVRLALGPRL